jgi:hypothetical protein
MKTFSAFAALCASSLAMASSIGTVPRSTATQYPAHTGSDQVAIGAVKLNEQAVRKTFSSDLNRCCIVVELAIFPAKDHPAKVSLGDFSLRIANTDTAVRPSAARVVASSLQRKAGSDHDVTVSPQFGVGYESGTYNDPYNNGGRQQRSSGVHTSAGVGVGIGSNQSGSTREDLIAMEAELSEKGLPEGTASAPVAGHLYFPISKKKNVKYQIEYTVDGQKMTVPLPE